MASEYKGLHVVFEGDTTGLNAALESIDKQTRTTQRNLSAINRALKFNPGNTKLLEQAMRQYDQQIGNVKKRLETLKQAQSDIGKRDINPEAWDRIEREIIECESKLDHYRAKLVEVAAAHSAIGQAGARFQTLGRHISDSSAKLRDFGDRWTRTVSLGMAVGGAAAMKAAVDIDTSLTNVRKTVDGTEAQYQQLKDAAIEFSKTNAVSPSQILDIQSLGAQLGYSVDELQGFSETVSGLDIATNMNAEEAAQQVAQFSNIMGTAHDETGNLGSAVVDLGNHFATTEADIMNMSMRIAAAGHQADMSEGDVLGLSTAMSSLGIEAEAGGTAISTTIAGVNRDVATNGATLQTWADLAGMSVEQFKRSWGDDAAGTFSHVIEGMQRVQDEGGNLDMILESLGITGIRQTDVMKRLASNSGMLTSAMETGNRAFAENTALGAEVANRNESLAAKFQMLKNRVTAVAEEVGVPLANALLDAIDAAEPLISAIERGARAFSEMSEGEQQAIVKALALVAAFGPATSTLGRIGGAAGSAISGIGNLAKKISEGAAAAGEGAGRMQRFAGGVGAIAGALKGAAIAGAIAAVVAAIAEWVRWQNTLADASMTTADIVSSAMGAATESVEGGASRVSVSYRSIIESMAEDNRKLQQSANETWGNVALIDSYSSTITGLMTQAAGGAGLTADEFARLQVAVDGYNGATGESISVTQSETGEITLMRGEAELSVGAFNDLTQAKINAAKAEWYQEDYEARFAQERDLLDAVAQRTETVEQAKQELADAERRGAEDVGTYRLAVELAEQALEDWEGKLEDCQRAMSADEEAMTLLGKSTGEAATEFDRMLAASDESVAALMRNEQSVQAFDDAMNAFNLTQEQLGAIGEEGLQKLAAAWDGSVASILPLLQTYGIALDENTARALGLDAVVIGDKTFYVDDAGTVMDEHGKVTGLDSLAVRTKRYSVTDGGTVGKSDSMLGRLDARKIGNKSFSVNATDNASGVIGRIRDMLSTLHSVTFGVNARSATGSFSDAPYIPRHADGYIADGPTLTNNGWVGEDGAEAVLNWGSGGAVIPLTNHRYMEPIAAAIAKNMDGLGTTNVSTTNVYIDGARVNDDAAIEAAFRDLMMLLQRKAMMNRG